MAILSPAQNLSKVKYPSGVVTFFRLATIPGGRRGLLLIPPPPPTCKGEDHFLNSKDDWVTTLQSMMNANLSKQRF